MALRKRVVAVPFLDLAQHAVPADHFLVDIGDDAGFERDQGMRDFEGRPRQVAGAGTALVGHDQAVFDLRREHAFGARIVEDVGEFGLEIDGALGAGRPERQRADKAAGKPEKHIAAAR